MVTPTMSSPGILVKSGGSAWKTKRYWPQATGPTNTASRTWSYFSLSAEPTYVSFHSRSVFVCLLGVCIVREKVE